MCVVPGLCTQFQVLSDDDGVSVEIHIGVNRCGSDPELSGNVNENGTV